MDMRIRRRMNGPIRVISHSGTVIRRPDFRISLTEPRG
jgi:hypothetical protein